MRRRTAFSQHHDREPRCQARTVILCGALVHLRGRRVGSRRKTEVGRGADRPRAPARDAPSRPHGTWRGSATNVATRQACIGPTCPSSRAARSRRRPSASYGYGDAWISSWSFDTTPEADGNGPAGPLARRPTLRPGHRSSHRTGPTALHRIGTGAVAVLPAGHPPPEILRSAEPNDDDPLHRLFRLCRIGRSTTSARRGA